MRDAAAAPAAARDPRARSQRTRQQSLRRRSVEAAPERRRPRPSARTAKADATANIVRNVWAHAIIFCGHFPDQTYTFSEEEVDDESRGGWYVRQLVGSANIEGSPLFHVASGNLGYQVEHHLFPDMPSTRYAEIAPQVKDVCERYGLPYNSGPFMPAAGDGPADDPAPRLPRRQAPAEAGALPRPEQRRTAPRLSPSFSPPAVGAIGVQRSRAGGRGPAR